MHPHTELRTVSPEIGVGVFATRRLPKGTILFVEDPLEITIPPDHPMLQYPAFRKLVDVYAIVKTDGHYEISWDYAKYVNHCCHYNAITTGFGFDIAIRDIEEGEQIRDDYGMFNVDYDMDLICSYEDCRRRVRTSDWDSCADQWEADARDALAHVREVPQVLWDIMDDEVRSALVHYLETGEGYISVRVLRKTDPDIHPGTEVHF